MKYILLSIITMLSLSIQSQSTIDKSIDVSSYNEVVLILDHTFLVELSNTTDDKISISAQSEGEYKDSVLLKVIQDEDTITIADDIQPFSKNYNDKLSAHKVIALKTKVSIPKDLKVTLRSRLASLHMDASFSSLFVELQAGDCLIDSFIGDAIINTFSGSISMHTNHATVVANSKSGIVTIEKTYGPHQVQLKSISGNISVYKTK